MSPASLNPTLPAVSLRGLLRASLDAVRAALRHPWLAHAFAAAPSAHHRLGAADLARSSLAREFLARRAARPQIHMKRRPARR